MQAESNLLKINSVNLPTPSLQTLDPSHFCCSRQRLYLGLPTPPLCCFLECAPPTSSYNCPCPCSISFKFPFDPPQLLLVPQSKDHLFLIQKHFKIRGHPWLVVGEALYLLVGTVFSTLKFIKSLMQWVKLLISVLCGALLTQLFLNSLSVPCWSPPAISSHT